MRLGFEHTYSGLPPRCFAAVAPAPAPDPQLIIFNAPLASELGLDPVALEPRAAQIFSGTSLPEDASPLAMAYAGHQFGGFVPSLGDGRAILLGELRDRSGALRDVQLKGAGRTPFSRGGDGRAVVGPMLREYVISEAMHRLRIPTTRSLAVVATGERVFRDQPLPGAVLTRIAASHVRVGTFQYFAARGDGEALRALLDFVIERHDPAARTAASPALALLEAVVARQARLIARWMQVGFIHGVMNTDNMALSGETIDYGPCAFMDEYDPGTVFSSIDRGGRYAYANQPAIAQWNLARLAETLLPLIHADPEAAVPQATAAIVRFSTLFDAAFLEGMRAKLGLADPSADEDAGLLRDLLALMQRAHADFTLGFRRLAELAAGGEESPFLESFGAVAPDAGTWLRAWRERVGRETAPAADRARAMLAANPLYVPRNHHVHAALVAAEGGDFAPLRRLLEVLADPFVERPGLDAYALPPQPEERVLQTFCGT